MAEERRADSSHSPEPTKLPAHDATPYAAHHDQQLTPPSTQPLYSSASRSSRSLRTCNANKSKLVYDLKYHPMDESLQPRRATSRREAHGESFDSFEESKSEGCLTGVESESESHSESHSESDVSVEGRAEGKKVTDKGKKRSLEKVLGGEETRRSARTTKAVNVLYDMKVHPQDDAIELSSGEESEESEQAEEEEEEPVSKRVKITTEPMDIGSKFIHESGGNVEDSESSGNEGQAGVDHAVQETEFEPVKETLRSLSTGREASTEVVQLEDGRIEMLVTPEPIAPHHKQTALSILSGGPFPIHVDSLSDQLAAEAQSTSPLNHEHNDQENNVEHHGFQESPGAMDLSSSQLFQQVEEEAQGLQQVALVEKAFYQDSALYRDPYGFATLDGSNDGYGKKSK